ncbi:hypothetical protein [Rhizosaccharibacter radicis]|uniref:Chaperone modulator CbpM n=1 Tax=Rhizosaccharibacter radicis TaxID=2782605 RepID=A0ABT1VV79_9PROT|nr:chaperone modulator CbpM [Acetobacteraceae bacterium KSS12]
MSRIVTIEIVCRDAGIEQHLVRQWIERDWVRPDPLPDGGFAFHEIDLARVHLLVQLRALEMGEAGMPVVLSLLDQLHDARRALRLVREAAARAPLPVRQSLLQSLDRASASARDISGTGEA